MKFQTILDTVVLDTLQNTKKKENQLYNPNLTLRVASGENLMGFLEFQASASLFLQIYSKTLIAIIKEM